LVIAIQALTSKVITMLPVICICASLTLVLLACFGIYNDMRLSFRTVSSHVSFQRNMFNYYKYLCVPLAFIFLGGGAYTVMSQDTFGDLVDELSDAQLSDLAEALDKTGSKKQLKDFLVAVMVFMGVIMICEGFTLLVELPLMWYMDKLHKERQDQLQEYEKDAQYARKEGVLKYLPAPGLSIIPQLKPFRDKIRHARQKQEQEQAQRDESKQEYHGIELRPPTAASKSPAKEAEFQPPSAPRYDAPPELKKKQTVRSSPMASPLSADASQDMQGIMVHSV